MIYSKSQEKDEKERVMELLTLLGTLVQWSLLYSHGGYFFIAATSKKARFGVASTSAMSTTILSLYIDRRFYDVIQDSNIF